MNDIVNTSFLSLYTFPPHENTFSQFFPQTLNCEAEWPGQSSTALTRQERALPKHSIILPAACSDGTFSSLFLLLFSFLFG